MIERWQKDEVVASLKCFRVVNITGARQCGKTTLAEMIPFSSAKRFTGWLIDGPNIPGRPFWVMRHRTPLLT